MNLHLSRCVLIAAVIVIAISAHSEESQKDLPLVRVERAQDVQVAYKERRGDHGFLFGLNYEPLLLKEYISALDNQSYGVLYGDESLPLIGLSLDYKYNFTLGSVTLGLNFGMGSLSSSMSGTKRTLEIQKTGAGLRFIADNIFAEPYVAPYVGLSMFTLDISEQSPSDKFKATTDTLFSYTIGLQIQLDWIDSGTDSGANFIWGLENTFLDLFMTQYLKPSDESGANTSTDMMLGGGFKFEF